MSRTRIYFITGGGTGGHIYPAVAVADALNNESDTKIYYVGNPKNLEYDIITQKGYEFLPVNIQGMPRKPGMKMIRWGIQLFIAIVKCAFHLKKYKPDVVFGTGGYVSAPILIAAKYMKVPYVMHDCDANPGLVTRKLAPSASSVSLAFECAKKFINNPNCFVNGNPVRDEFKTLTKENARIELGLKNKTTLCIMGGSQGAKSINVAAVNILKTLSNDFDIQVIFQTGKKKFETVEEHLSAVYPEYKADKNLIVRPYFDDMVTILKASDIAVSRAGSLSISELCACGIAAIYVPYPYAAADHQRKNARFMSEKGAGIYLEDNDVTSEKLLGLITELTTDKEKLHSLRNSALNLAKYEGVSSIISMLKK